MMFWADSVCIVEIWCWNAQQELYSGLIMVKCSAGAVQWSYDGKMFSRSCTVVLWWWNAQQQLYSAHMMVECSAGVVQWSYDGEMLRRNCTMISWWWNAQQELYIIQHAVLSRWCQYVCCGATRHWYGGWMLSRYCFMTWQSMTLRAEGISVYNAVPLTAH